MPRPVAILLLWIAGFPLLSANPYPYPNYYSNQQYSPSYSNQYSYNQYSSSYQNPYYNNNYGNPGNNGCSCSWFGIFRGNTRYLCNCGGQLSITFPSGYTGW